MNKILKIKSVGSSLTLKIRRLETRYQDYLEDEEFGINRQSEISSVLNAIERLENVRSSLIGVAHLEDN